MNPRPAYFLSADRCRPGSLRSAVGRLFLLAGLALAAVTATAASGPVWGDIPPPSPVIKPPPRGIVSPPAELPAPRPAPVEPLPLPPAPEPVLPTPLSPPIIAPPVATNPVPVVPPVILPPPAPVTVPVEPAIPTPPPPTPAPAPTNTPPPPPAAAPAAPAPAIASFSPRTQDKRVFSFRAEKLELKAALAAFARLNGLNIIPDREVSGEITLEVQDLPLDQMMNALLEANGCVWTEEMGLIRVRVAPPRRTVRPASRVTRPDPS